MALWTVALGALPAAGSGIRNARVGDWITYRLQRVSGSSAYWRLAVVGEEKDSLQRDAVWLEIETADHPSLNAPLQQLRLLVARDAGLTRSGISRLFVAIGMESAAEVDGNALESMLPGIESLVPTRPPPGAAIRHGKSTMLATAEGSLEATPIDVYAAQTLVQRIWISPSLPILQLARLELPNLRYSLEVHAHGTDARTRMILPEVNSPTIRLEPRGQAP